MSFIDQIIANAEQYITTNPWLGIAVVFLGGLLTASNPCVLAMIPLMMGFVAGQKESKPGPLHALGMIAALAGKLYGDVSSAWSWIVAGVCLVMGLHLMGVLKFTIPMPFEVKPRTRGVLGALVLGLLFGVVSAPCAAPVLVVLLTYLAGSGSSVVYGGLLLLVYALGHSVLIIVAGTSMGAARRLIESKRLTRATDILRRVAGAVIILVGAYFLYRELG